jgi:hypothetical protein
MMKAVALKVKLEVLMCHQSGKSVLRAIPLSLNAGGASVRNRCHASAYGCLDIHGAAERKICQNEAAVRS